MKTRLAICLGALAIAATGYVTGSRAAASSLVAPVFTRSPSSVAAPAPPPKANPAVIGLALSGVGSSLKPPTSPTDKPYNSDCHALIDPGFSGKCVVAVAPTGTVAGVVEQETAVLAPRSASKTAKSGPGPQERDLVWHRVGKSWALALVHVFQNPGLPSLVWADDIERDHDPKLVFVMPSGRVGFGTELDLVEGTGAVTLYRSLGEGFADVPAAGGLVTYVPGWTEQDGPEDAYDQTLIGYSSGAWRVFSEQYVPDAAALRQHRGAFWDSRAVAGQ
jgi:hypothetical protein